MAYCKNCGKEIDDKAVICVHCGVPQSSVHPAQSNNPDAERKATGAEIAASILIPIVGVIMGIVYLAQGKKKAGTTALIAGIIAWLAYYVLILGG